MSILARLSLANRSLIALAVVAVVAFGVLSTASLRQELIPSLQLPMTITSTTYPGASPEIVDREVTQPLEQAISGVNEVDRTTATSANGVSIIQAEFTYGTDLDNAVQQLQQAVNRTSNQLPTGAEADTFAGSFDDFPVVLLAASSDLDHQEFASQLEDTAVPELGAIDGVREVEVTGTRSQQLLIDVDPEALSAARLSLPDVTQALEANGVNIPGGDLTWGDRTLPVEVGGSFADVGELEDLLLTPSQPAPGAESEGTPEAPPEGEPAPETEGETGAGTEGETEGGAGGETEGGAGSAPGAAAPTPVRLAEVAEVELGLAEPTSITRTDGTESIGVSITKEPDGDTVRISHDVSDALADIEEAIGNGTELSVVFDQAPFIEESIEGLTSEGLLGLVFAVLVILVFLLSIRSTIVTAVSIPLSLLIAMIGVYAGGYSLNILTLAALTISVGRVVDDSIVVLENIKRHLAYGEDKRRAILTGTREVAGAITAATLTTAGVFLPIAFVGGQAGELFRPFSVTVAIALLASLVVALTVIPVLAYWFMRPSPVSEGDEEEVRAAALAKERRNPLQRAYVPVIEWATGHRVITIVAGIAIFAGTLALTPLLHTNFLDPSGQNMASITQTLPAGSSLERTDEAARQVEEILEAEDGVESYQVTVGGSGFNGFGGGATNEASFSITTDPDADQEQLVDRIRDQVDELDNAGTTTVHSGDAMGPGAGDVEVIATANDSDTLAEAATTILDAVDDVSGTTNVENNLADAQPAIRIAPDRAEAANYGLTDAQIGQTVRAAFEGQPGEPIRVADQQRDVLLRTGDAPTSLDEVEQLELATPTGEVVTVADVAEVSEVEEPAELTRIDGDRTATITATPDDADVGGLTQRLDERLAELSLPSGVSYEIGGVAAEQESAFADLGVALLAAIAIVFLVMVATFKSLIQPLILMISVPFAATGALIGLLVTDTALGVPALIGVLMLVGIVVTNAIVLIDLINQYRDAGMSVRDAVIEGGRQRLRPILMTALATIFALFPMSLGLTGGGVFVSQPLAIVVIGGLVSSTLLTLVFVPTLYSMVEGLKERRAAKRTGRPEPSGSGEPTQPTEPAGDSDHAAAGAGRRRATAARPGLPPGPAPAEPAPASQPVQVTTSVPSSEPDENGSGDEITRVQVVQVEIVVRGPQPPNGTS